MRFTHMAVGVLSAAATCCLGLSTAFASTSVTVTPGETMYTIAKSYGVSLQSLESANPTVNPNWLVVGSSIKIPATQSSNASANLYWMAHVINAEAGGESLQAKIAVGDVILHRLRSGVYGSNVKDVVFAVTNGHYQFTSVANGYIYTNPNASSAQAASDVLRYDDDIVPGSFVFYNPTQTPWSSWVRKQPFISQYGNLVFAK